MTMTTAEVAKRLVELCNEDRPEEAYQELYSESIVSIEGVESEDMPVRVEGMAGLAAKGKAFEEQTEVHSMKTEGPYIGLRDDQFIAYFELDATMRASGERVLMRECGLYTVKDGKIVQEEFLYLMDD